MQLIREGIMQDHEEILFRNSLIKCRQAFDDAAFSIQGQRKQIALNRIYYSIFYASVALGYKHGFVTSKHVQLMGWFNKKFINQEKTFSEKMGKIYKTSFLNRQEADYEMLTATEMSIDQIKSLFNDCEFFLKTVFEYLKEPFTPTSQ